MIRTEGKEFKVGIENGLHKGQLIRGVIERLKENSIKRGKYFITITLIIFSFEAKTNAPYLR